MMEARQAALTLDHVKADEGLRWSRAGLTIW